MCILQQISPSREQYFLYFNENERDILQTYATAQGHPVSKIERLVETIRENKAFDL